MFCKNKMSLEDRRKRKLKFYTFWEDTLEERLAGVRAAKAKLKIAEIPGNEPARIGGERKLKIVKWGAAYYFQFIRELWFWR